MDKRAWLLAAEVVSAVRNSQVGWSVKATKMLLVARWYRLRKRSEVQGSFGMVRCMALTKAYCCDINHVDPSLSVGLVRWHALRTYVNCGNPFCNRRILASEGK